MFKVTQRILIMFKETSCSKGQNTTDKNSAEISNAGFLSSAWMANLGLSEPIAGEHCTTRSVRRSVPPRHRGLRGGELHVPWRMVGRYIEARNCGTGELETDSTWAETVSG